MFWVSSWESFALFSTDNCFEISVSISLLLQNLSLVSRPTMYQSNFIHNPWNWVEQYHKWRPISATRRRRHFCFLTTNELLTLEAACLPSVQYPMKCAYVCKCAGFDPTFLISSHESSVLLTVRWMTMEDKLLLPRRSPDKHQSLIVINGIHHVQYVYSIRAATFIMYYYIYIYILFV